MSLLIFIDHYGKILILLSFLETIVLFILFIEILFINLKVNNFIKKLEME